MDIKIRIIMVNNAFNKRREVFTKRMNIELNNKVKHTIVWSLLLYGLETWTLRKYDRDILEAFKMWTWCRIPVVRIKR